MSSGLKRIPVAGPWITEREIAYVTDAVTRGWYAAAGEYGDRFERAFAAWLGVRHAVALPSCTSAIHLALLALGVGPGDEVIVPESTWIASAAPVTYVGATPVFADVDPITWCLSPASAARLVGPATKAIIAVDLYGGMADLPALRALGVPVIEDAAQAAGAELHGRRAGSLGDVGVFSFHGTKTLTTGEGGMLVSDRDDLVERVRFLRDHGRLPGAKLFWNGEVAQKYRMSAMQAALGLAQLERIEELVARKRQIFTWYARELPGTRLNVEPAGTRHVYWMVTALLDRAKEDVMRALGERGIDSRPFFYPLSSLPAYAGARDAARAARENPVAYALSPGGINLPSALCLDEEDVVRVCAALREVLA